MRTRIGDGNSFSTAYTKGFMWDGAVNVPMAQYANSSSLYWQGRAKEAVSNLSKAIPDNGEWEAWWANIPESATSRDIAKAAEAELRSRNPVARTLP